MTNLVGDLIGVGVRGQVCECVTLVEVTLSET
jgi:hypothetical protein